MKLYAVQLLMFKSSKWEDILCYNNFKTVIYYDSEKYCLFPITVKEYKKILSLTWTRYSEKFAHFSTWFCICILDLFCTVPAHPGPLLSRDEFTGLCAPVSSIGGNHTHSGVCDRWPLVIGFGRRHSEQYEYWWFGL